MSDDINARLSQLAGDFVVRLRRIAPGAGVESILPADISRFSLLMTLSGFAACTVWPSSDIALNEGIALSSTTPLQLTYRDFGPVMGFQWFSSAGFGGAVIHIIEVCYKPGGNS